MPRSKITTAAEREIGSLLVQKRTPRATMKHLEWISCHLSLPLWQVKAVAKRDGLRFDDPPAIRRDDTAAERITNDAD